MRTALAPPESVVAEIWERQLFDPSALAGLELSLIYRGTPSDAGGPDYQDAVLASRSGVVARGDIEFHRRSSDWYRHGHHTDPAYNRVVLHVVWEIDTPATLNQLGESVPCLTLSGYTAAAEGTPQLAPHGCIVPLGDLAEPVLREKLRGLGIRRMEERADRLREEIRDVGADQTAYVSLLEGLGYAGNRSGFRELADVVPFSILADTAEQDRTELLLAAAGFTSERPGLAPAHLPVDAWRLARLRPQNHPVRRIQAIVPMLRRLQWHPSNAIVDAVMSCKRPTELVDLLVVSGTEGPLVGRGRALEMVVSIVLPFSFAAAGGDRAAELLQRLAPPPATRWTRAFGTLLPAPFRVRTAAEHQGVHEVYTHYCRWERASGCPLCSTPIGETLPCRTNPSPLSAPSPEVHQEPARPPLRS